MTFRPSLRTDDPNLTSQPPLLTAAKKHKAHCLLMIMMMTCHFLGFGTAGRIIERAGWIVLLIVLVLYPRTA